MRSAVQRTTAPTPQCVWEQVERSARFGIVPGTPHADEPVAIADEHPPAFVSSGHAALDACLGGGYARGMLSELIGESSSGKTQLVLYTATCTALGLGSRASVLLNGTGHSVALIATHGRSAARHMVHRMAQIAQACLADAYGHECDARIEHGVRAMLRNVVIACAFTFESAQHVLCYTLPGLMERQRVRGPPVALVVLDSVPPLLQEDSLETPIHSSGSAHSVRAARLHALATWLKRLATPAPASAPAPAVVVVNHVSDAFDHDKAFVRHARSRGELAPDAPRAAAPPPTAPLLPLAYAAQAAHFSGLLASVHREDADLKTAQLGLVWANCVNARYLVAHTPPATRRRLAVVFAPTAPARQAATFAVTARGIDTLA